MSEDHILLLVYLAPLVLILAIYIALQKRRDRQSLALLDAAHQAGMKVPDSLHPVIDPSQCIGCGACVSACPEHNVLGLVQGKAHLVSPSNCIGHGACQKACPVGAIHLVFGSSERGVDIPVLNADFQTSLPGIYIAGELGGMGLIRNAVEQGRQAMVAIAESLPKDRPKMLDVVIIGAGPAGISASLGAQENGLNYVTLDQEANLGGTVAHFPRGKLVMTQPATLPIVGKVKLTETSKESLLGFWQDILKRHTLNLQFGTQVQHIETHEDHLVVHTPGQSFPCHRVLLAIGRRGSPRKLNVPGEDLSKVVYRLIDPSQYRGQAVLVVGGGDSALEAAASVAEEDNTEVTLAYRGDNFNRAKAKNRERIKALEQAGKLSVLFNTEPSKIDINTVHLLAPDGEKILANDSVIVCAGGELPTGFLKKIGISVETKYGTA